MPKVGFSLNDLMAGRLVLALNPWLGTPYAKKALIFRRPAPWYYKRWGGGKLSPKQKQICEIFARVARETRGMKRIERIKRISELMIERLRAAGFTIRKPVPAGAE